MQLGLEQGLSSLVKAKYTEAKTSQAIVFSETELTTIKTRSGVPFQLRYCPALGKKPKNNDDASKKQKKPDPFDNPPADLLIAELPRHDPSHILVLNKYPVIPQHFILATKTNKEQTHMLEPQDLAVTHACLRAWEESTQGRKVFGFFNSGNHSGASQSHRHLQFLPVDEMARDGDAGGWEVLINCMLQGPAQPNAASFKHIPGLPFVHFAASLPPEPTMQQLESTYHSLYDAAAASVRSCIDTHKGDLELHPSEGGSSPISYNLAITTAGMAIIPRRKEGTVLRDEAGQVIGDVALNGTVLAGTLMVKQEVEWELLKTDPEQLESLLDAIGIPIPVVEQNRL